MDHKTHLENLIAEGEVGEAIKELLEAVKQNNQRGLYNDMIILSGRYTQQQAALREERITNESYNIGIAKIRHALLYYVGKYQPNGQYKFKQNIVSDDGGNEQANSAEVVFISYSRTDREIAIKLKQFLEGEGFTVIMDETHAVAGESLQAFIHRSVQESGTTLSLVSSRSLLSVWVANESINSFVAGNISEHKFIAAFIDQSFFKRSFVDDALDKIDEEIEEINGIIKRRLDRGRNITDLQEELKRFKDLQHSLPNIVQRLKEHLSVDIADDQFEAGLRKIISAIRS